MTTRGNAMKQGIPNPDLEEARNVDLILQVVAVAEERELAALHADLTEAEKKKRVRRIAANCLRRCRRIDPNFRAIKTVKSPKTTVC